MQEPVEVAFVGRMRALFTHRGCLTLHATACTRCAGRVALSDARENRPPELTCPHFEFSDSDTCQTHLFEIGNLIPDGPTGEEKWCSSILFCLSGIKLLGDPPIIDIKLIVWLMVGACLTKPLGFPWLPALAASVVNGGSHV